MPTPTPAQLQCIRQTGNVLVVASAGTGKTSTLVQRCVHLLLEDNCSLEQILMVTFTDAAAAQMRSRIRQELHNLLESPAHAAKAEHIQKQLSLLDAAHVCTLHSFCLQLVRQHFYRLGIAPAVLVLDEKQTGPLITQTLDALFEKYYEANEGEGRAVQELVALMGRGSDEAIRNLVLKLHRYSQVLPNPEEWLAGQMAIYDQAAPNAWRQWLPEALESWRTFWARELELQEGSAPAVEFFLGALRSLEKFTKGARGQNTSEMANLLGEVVAADKERGSWPRGSTEILRKPFKHFLEDVKFLHSALAADDQTTDPMQQDWEWIRPHIRTLLQVTQEFGEHYSHAKREMGGVDFSDLEQFALRLLRDPAVARPWQQRFRYIFVDECQDINRAQDAILTLLSREGTQPNRFLVGDVKQSIYRFRLANPKIFCDYEAAWREAGGNGRRIPLSDNFRSREAILEFANSVFNSLMRPIMGGIGYDQDVYLRFGDRDGRLHLSQKPPPPHNVAKGPAVELHFLGEAAEETEGEGGEAPEKARELLDLMAIEREARLVASRLRDMKESKHLVWDTDEKVFRPVQWRDMVILLRSPAGRVEAFAKEFHRLGVPLSAARNGFFSSIEITDLLSVLRLLDNPLQDVPLLAVLRSPLVALSLDELVEMRTHNSQKPLWLALQAFHKAGRTARGDGKKGASTARDVNLYHSAWDKVDRFQKCFEGWRLLARQSSLSACLERILTDTEYLAVLLAEPRGEERVANVRRLLDLVREYDPWQRQGLYRFLRFVKMQEEAEVEMEPASAQTEDAVRLMSIHRSKGLEFPVVVLAATGTQFNRQDLNAVILLHEKYGICPRITPPEGLESYPSLAYWMARREEQCALLGEELRLLYVAVTRARDNLIVTGSKKILLLPEGRTSAPTDRELLGARCYLDWILLWLPQAVEAAEWNDGRAGETELFTWRKYAANDASLLAAATSAPVSTEESEASNQLPRAELLKLQERILFEYRYSAATVEPAIKRISEVIWTNEAADEPDQLLLRLEPRGPANRRRAETRDPDGLAANEIGDAHHRFLEGLDLAQANQMENLQSAAQVMLETGELTEEELQALDLAAVCKFWNSSVGRRILGSSPHEIHRELPFTVRLFPRDLAQLGLCANARELESERFIARGKVDLAVIKANEIWVLDFKTDRVSPADIQERSMPYRRQLKLYALALEQIYRRPVTERWLHFLSAGKTLGI